MIPIINFSHILKTAERLKKIHSFVQVGSHDGIMHDPLHTFIKHNKWKGILIEPQKLYFDKLKLYYKKRPNLFFINKAVHPSKKKLTLFKVKNANDYSHTGWASVHPERFKNTEYEHQTETEEVEACTLMEAIESCKITSLDLLQIDTEGFDFEIIKMLDFKKITPLIIHYEHIHLSNKDKKKAGILLNMNEFFSFKSKNDTIALSKKLITPQFIITYIFVRFSDTIRSRIKFFRFLK